LNAGVPAFYAGFHEPTSWLNRVLHTIDSFTASASITRRARADCAASL